MLVWAWRYSEKMESSDGSEMSRRFSGFTLPMTSFHQQMCQRCCLPRVFEVAFGPLGPKDISWWKILLLPDSVPAYTTKTTQRLLVEFWFLADWPQCLPDLNPSHPEHFAGESPGYASLKSSRSMSVYHLGMGPASSGKHPQTCRSFRRHH